MRRVRGFTLIELMVVIVILGGLIGLVGMNIWGAHRTSSDRIAQAQLSSFDSAIQAYRLQHRRLPAALEDLTARTEARPEPYLTSVPRDPWGNAYEYRPEGGSAFTLRSAGEDGTSGTVDDVVWPLVEPERAAGR
jgi:general secretion pathway protein G